MTAASSYVRLTVLAALLAGCATLPRADIALIKGPQDVSGTELDTYAFPRSVIDLAWTEDKSDVAITVVNRSFEDFRIGLRRHDGFGVRTNLNLTKVTNSDLLEKAGVEVFDDRIKIIGEIGKVAKAVVGLGLVPFTAATAAPLKLPPPVDAMTLIGPYADGRGDAAEGPLKPLPNSQGISYWVGRVQPDARAVAPGAFAGLRNGLVYAACREVRLKFAETEKSVYVSDPRFFRYVAFPQKGKIEVHSQCGTSVSSEKDASIASDPAVLNAVLDELKGIKDAVEAEKKKDKAAEKPEADKAGEA